LRGVPRIDFVCREIHDSLYLYTLLLFHENPIIFEMYLLTQIIYLLGTCLSDEALGTECKINKEICRAFVTREMD